MNLAYFILAGVVVLARDIILTPGEVAVMVLVGDKISLPRIFFCLTIHLFSETDQESGHAVANDC